ncbi:MAG: hypothetical protein WC708_15935, partial [Lentisphaeria bacterium]
MNGFFWGLLGAACLLAARTTAVMPEDGTPYLDQKIELQRDMAQQNYDPGAQETAAEQRRQQVRDAMAQPPVDAPNYRLAMQQKPGLLTAGAAPAPGTARPPVLSLGETEIPLVPAAVAQRGRRFVLDVL